MSGRGKEREISSSFIHPIAFFSATKHPGALPLKGSALSVDGAEVSAVKPSEDGAGIAVRLFDTTGADREAKISACRPIACAYLCRSDEKKLHEIKPEANTLTVTVPANGTVTVVIH